MIGQTISLRSSASVLAYLVLFVESTENTSRNQKKFDESFMAQQNNNILFCLLMMISFL